jgi:hypothetical protein
MCAWLAEILELHCGILASYCKKGSYGESKMSENDLEDWAFGVSGLDTTKSTSASKIGPTASPLDCIPTSGADHFFELPGEVKRPILAAQGWGYPQEFT